MSTQSFAPPRRFQLQSVPSSDIPPAANSLRDCSAHPAVTAQLSDCHARTGRVRRRPAGKRRSATEPPPLASAHVMLEQRPPRRAAPNRRADAAACRSAAPNPRRLQVSAYGEPAVCTRRQPALQSHCRSALADAVLLGPQMPSVCCSGSGTGIAERLAGAGARSTRACRWASRRVAGQCPIRRSAEQVDTGVVGNVVPAKLSDVGLVNGPTHDLAGLCGPEPPCGAGVVPL